MKNVQDSNNLASEISQKESLIPNGCIRSEELALRVCLLSKKMSLLSENQLLIWFSQTKLGQKEKKKFERHKRVPCVLDCHQVKVHPTFYGPLCESLMVQCFDEQS